MYFIATGIDYSGHSFNDVLSDTTFTTKSGADLFPDVFSICCNISSKLYRLLVTRESLTFASGAPVAKAVRAASDSVVSQKDSPWKRHSFKIRIQTPAVINSEGSFQRGSVTVPLVSRLPWEQEEERL